MVESSVPRLFCGAFHGKRLLILVALILTLGLFTFMRLQPELSINHLNQALKGREVVEDQKYEETSQPVRSTELVSPVPRSKESVGPPVPISETESVKENPFVDMANLKIIPQANRNDSSSGSPFRTISVKESEIEDVLKFARETPLGKPKRDYQNMTTVAKLLRTRIRKDMSALKKFQLNIGQFDLYRDDKEVNKIIEEMRNLPIESSEQNDRGTQFKLIFTFENEQRALFKPQRFPREVGTWENHYYFSDFERHYSEIASFHLDRLLGFRRAVPVTGRYISISDDVQGKTSERVDKTLFRSPANNLCMVGECKYYCDTGHAICGHPDKVQGSFAAYLPSFDDFPITRFYSPYRRSYSKRKKAKWENNPKYCEVKVMTNSKYNTGRLLLDMIDMYIFDFLTGNMDRHHMEHFTLFETDPYLIHLDHGRGFGKPHHDDLSILTPLIQCCVIRLSTVKTLASFHDGPKLSERMRKAMADDPAAPILLEAHLSALDRRVKIVLKHIQLCVEENEGVDEVISDDGY